jgi:hypothetical protein
MFFYGTVPSLVVLHLSAKRTYGWKRFFYANCADFDAGLVSLQTDVYYYVDAATVADFLNSVG